MHQTVQDVTERIINRSRKHRLRYLQNMEENRVAGTSRHRLPCSNLAHAMAVCRVRMRRECATSTRPYRHYNVL